MKTDILSVNSNWERLYPAFAKRALAAVLEANRESLGKFEAFQEWRLFEGYRSQARQDSLYAQGRSRPGAIVTHRRVSFHTSGLAADIVWRDIRGELRWDGEQKLWDILGHCARAQGLEWGGDFPKLTGGSFVDPPHLQPNLRERILWKLPARLYLRKLGL